LSEIDVRLREAFGDGRVRRDVRLGPLTTFKVGGPADWLLELHGSDELRLAVRIARDAAIPVTVLGGGSNVLIADDGIRGLVIRVHGGEVSARGPAAVRADAGVTINGLVRWTITHGVAGLEAWAGTPGTVGGAVFGNAHFQGRLISELVERVMLVTLAGDLADVPAGEMPRFGRSRGSRSRSGSGRSRSSRRAPDASFRTRIRRGTRCLRGFRRPRGRWSIARD
jgi:UDP-N-acetylmuramate dehydrogenase